MQGLYGIGVADRSVRLHQRKRRYPVLLFHRVSRHPDPYWPPLHPDVFRNILSFFSSYYSFLPLEDLLKETPLPDDAAFITFDDAFVDVREEAVPILQELQLPATLYVPSGSIDSREVIWSSLLDRYLEREANAGASSIELGGLSFEMQEVEQKGKEAAVGAFKERLMGLPYDRQMELRKALEGQGLSDHIRPMSWDELKELPESIGIGAHTVHHPYLPSLEDEADIEREMKASKEQIEEMTGRRVRTFAYPFGGYDERAEAIAARHFDLSFTTEGDMIDEAVLTDTREKQRLSRIDVHDRAPQEALLRVTGFHQKVRKLFSF